MTKQAKQTKITFTGGGTAGHVIPNLPLIESFQEKGWSVSYIGSANGPEQKLMADRGIPFYTVRSGKLRRYMSLRNLMDPFNILIGCLQASWRLFRIKPKVVFSKGGFVAFPVVVAAWLNRIPVVCHESDLTPGLANKLSYPFVKSICLTFDTSKHATKAKFTGTPIRPQLFKGKRDAGLSLCEFTPTKPTLMMIGGSQGANTLNKCLRSSLPTLLDQFQVIHICGKGKTDDNLQQAGYKQFEYVDSELPDLIAASDLVISRAGSNTLHELLALHKPHVLVPLSARISRGDQIQNAKFYKNKGISVVIDEDALTPDILHQAIQDAMQDQDTRMKHMQALHLEDGTQRIVDIILSAM